jgi:protein associated with RNAse G/E
VEPEMLGGVRSFVMRNEGIRAFVKLSSPFSFDGELTFFADMPDNVCHL